MRALWSGVPRALADHRTEDAVAYRRYVAAVLARLGPLGADGRVWLRGAGLLTLRLDRIHREAQAAEAALMSGGRRAREKARAQLRQLERRAARLRASLENVERRLEELAGHRPPAPSIQEYIRSQAP